jgi:hypothetical protein
MQGTSITTQPSSSRKTCADCKREQPLENFYRSKQEKDGHTCYCKPCLKARSATWQRENPEKANARSRRWQKAHPEKVKANRPEQLKRYREKYPKKVKAQSLVREAVYRGRLTKPDRCEGCGKKLPRRRIHGHHADYDKPLEVEWLCALCHSQRHPF